MYAENQECTHDCSTCSAGCSSASQQSFIEKPHEMSHIKRVIGVVSGKGGVGKSMITSLLAVMLNRRGYKTAIMDADITGPSIPKMFGIKDRATGDDYGIFPVRSKTGIEIMSLNVLLDNETVPVIWRGPVIAGTVKQFWTDVIWSDVDFMFVDMPPGTGDVPLTVFQSIPVDGIIVVTSPQELVSMIVKKAVNMAQLMNVPIIGLIENMSYVECPDCHKRIYPFGESHADKLAEDNGIKLISRIPISSELAKNCDSGLVELFEGDFMEDAADRVEIMM